MTTARTTMTPAQRDRVIDQLQHSIQVLRHISVVTPCAECAHFNGGSLCEKWNAPVPPEARADGCGEWEEGVPF